MPRRKPPIPKFLLANRLGCFLIAAVLAAFIGIVVYLALSAPTENPLNMVIPTPR